MKGFTSTLLALMIVLAATAVYTPAAHADDDPGAFLVGLCSGGHQGGSTTDGDDAPPTGDLEGDPENWLGGQNSVADDPIADDDGGGLLEWISNLFSRFLRFAR